MAKKKERPKGFLHKRPNGAWALTYSGNVMTEDGTIRRKRIKHTLGGPMTKDVAREAADTFLATLPAGPTEIQTVQRFATTAFFPKYVKTLKKSTQRHYTTILMRHVLPALGNRRLDRIDYNIVQELVNFKGTEQRGPDGKVIRKPLSNQSLVHIRNVLSAMFKFANTTGAYRRPNNPAKGIRIGPVSNKPRHTFTGDEARLLIAALPTPAREMAMIAATTSLNRAEFLGLRWGRVNLTEQSQIRDGLIIYPHSLLVFEDCYKGVLDTTKTPKRIRIVPLPKAVVASLQALKTAAQWTEADDLLFVNPARRGQAIHIRNLESRVFEPIIRKFGFPAGTGWHSFRRAWATLADDLGFEISDRIAGMGHADLAMTLRYTKSNVERRRAGNEQISARLALDIPVKPSAQMNLFDEVLNIQHLETISESVLESVKI